VIKAKVLLSVNQVLRDSFLRKRGWTCPQYDFRASPNEVGEPWDASFYLGAGLGTMLRIGSPPGAHGGRNGRRGGKANGNTVSEEGNRRTWTSSGKCR